MEIHGVSVEESLHALQTLFKADVDPKRVAAIIIELVQGEGGFYAAPAELLRALRKVCDEHGILLIFDEIQTGFARTGKMFATEHYDVLPDIMTIAKSMAGGMTLSAVCGKTAVMDGPAPGGLGGTYTGNPLAIAASHAVIDVIEKEKLVERSNVLGKKLTARLNTLKGKVPALKEVRGLGSMVAAEFFDPATGEPSPDAVKRVQQAALAEGLILLTCGVYANVIRFLYPLTTEDSVFDEALGILDRAMMKA
jgi:4-aminobutyrate aminotransferase